MTFSSRLAPRVALLIVGLVALVHGPPVAAGSLLQASRAKPPIAKACGSIHVSGKRLRVDITEVINVKARGCRAARTVMRRFVRTSPPVMGNGRARYHGRVYDCYRSRLDGEGWDYHCSWSSTSGGPRTRFIDFGAGRRF